MLVMHGAHGRRRLTKTLLWDLYWRVNEAKCWLYYSHCMISNNHHDCEFAHFLETTWQNDSDRLSFDSMHLVYV